MTGGTDQTGRPVGDGRAAETVAPTSRLDPTRSDPAAPEPGTPDPHGEVDPGGHSGPLVPVLSATGGAGRSLLASNAAVWLHRNGYERVVLVDLDTAYGSPSTSLRLRLDHTLADVCRLAESGQAVDDDELYHCLAHHASGVWVLGSAGHPTDAFPDPAALASVLGGLRRTSDAVVLDTTVGLAPHLLPVMPQMTRAVVVASLDVHAVRAARLLLGELAGHGLGPGRRTVVINRADPGVGLDFVDTTAYLDDQIAAWLPSCDEVRRSMNEGRPLVASQPRHAVVRSLEPVFASLQPDSGPLGNPDPAALAPSARWWSLRRLRGLDEGSR
ncbi:MAG: CpaE family protein [Acidimicrobiales bacterium]